MINIVAGNLYFSVHLVRLTLKVLMKNDREFMEVMPLNHTMGLYDRDWELFPTGQKTVLFSAMFIPNLGSTQLPVQWIVGGLPLDVQHPGHGAILPLPHTSSWCGAELNTRIILLYFWYIYKLHSKT
jgi:hypothetical protein